MSSKTIAIPAELQGLKSFTNWVAYRNKWQPEKGKNAKIPINPHKGIEAKANDPSTWGSYNQAVQAALDRNLAGVGFELGQLQGAATKGQILAGIDLDHVIHDGVIDPEAQRIIDTVDSYTELSPSGTGIHILFYLRGDIARSLKAGNAPDGSMEFYTGCLSTGDPDKPYKQGRYFTVTGQPWGEPKKIRDRSEVIPGLHAQHWKKEAQGAEAQTPSVVMPQQVQASAGSADGWREYVRQNLPAILSYLDPAPQKTWIAVGIALKSFGESIETFDEWSQRANYGGRQQIERWWASWSRLNAPSEAGKTLYNMAKKEGWNPPREGMPQITEQDRWETAQNDFSAPVQGEPQGGTQGSAEAPPLTVIPLHRLSDVEDQEDDFLFDPYVPIGKLTMLSADSGTGKTYLACNLVALATGGRSDPASGLEATRTGNVLLFSSEDDQPVLKKRIKYAGGDLSKVLMPEGIDMIKLGLKDDIIFQTIRATKPIMVVLDPLQLFLNGIDMNKANQTRPLLFRLAAVAKQVGCAVVLVAHHGKQVQRSVYASIGSVDIPSAMRSILALYRNPIQEKGEFIRAIHVKSSNAKNGKTIDFRLVSVMGEKHVGKVEWIGLSDYKQADYMRDLKLAERLFKSAKYTAKEEGKEENPLRRVLIQLAKENEKEIRIDLDSLKEAHMKITGKMLHGEKTPITKAINLLAPILEQEDRIAVDVPAGTYRASEYFIVNGEKVEVQTDQGRLYRIKRL